MNTLRIGLLGLFLPLQLQAAEPAIATSVPVEDAELAEIVVQAPEPRYVAPTNRDRIGRVWVPVYINEKGPFRLVLDSGATRSALTPKVAGMLDLPLDKSPPVMLRGVTGSAIAPTVTVDSISVGDLWVGPSTVPIVEDAFGGAEGLLGTDGMRDKRIFIDFRNDFINISRSRNRRAASMQVAWFSPVTRWTGEASPQPVRPSRVSMAMSTLPARPTLAPEMAKFSRSGIENR